MKFEKTASIFMTLKDIIFHNISEHNIVVKNFK